MEDADTVESYSSINDNYIPVVIYAFCALGGFTLLEKTASATVLEVLGGVLIVGGMLFQAFRKRTCPFCQRQMTRYFNGQLIPKYHYCAHCKVKIDVIVRTRTT